MMKESNKYFKIKFLYIIIGLIIISAALVLILIPGKKHASDFSDLVADFYDITPLEIIYSSYNSGQHGHLQPVLAIDESGITDISSDDFFLGPLFHSKRAHLDSNKIELKSLGILYVYYRKEMNGTSQSFVRMTTNDGIIYFKHVNNTDKLIYGDYYSGIEADVLNYLGNEDWYSYAGTE